VAHDNGGAGVDEFTGRLPLFSGGKKTIVIAPV